VAQAGSRRASTEGIWLGGQRIDRLVAESRVKLGLGHVLEGRHIFPGLTVDENLELGVAVVARRPLAQALDRAYALFPDLKSRQNQAAGTLSGGQQQFLAIARAVMSDPTILLLDEPTVGLAPRLIERVGEMIVDLVREGTTVLMVEQALEVVVVAAQSVLMLSHGRIVEITTGDDPQLTELTHRVYLS
jgi:ABC-type branched-subunit amino acid transport system ATPase component